MSERLRNVAVLVVGGVLLLVSMWVANQGALAPMMPAKFAASIYLLLTSLPVVAVLWAAAVGFGYPIRRCLDRETPFAGVLQAGVGLGVLLLAHWLLAWAGFTSRAAAWSLVGAGIALLVVQLVVTSRRDQGVHRPAPRLPVGLILAAIPLGPLLVATTMPPGSLWRVEAYGYDVLSYHLQVPREWLAAGAMVPLHHNVYGFLPSLMEAAYLLIGSLRGGEFVEAVYVCQLFHASLGVVAAIAVGCAVAQLTSASAGAAAGAVLLATPWVLITGSLAYNEMAVLAFGAAAMLALLDIRSERPRVAAVIGFLVGCATLAKPTAGPMLAVPIGLVLLTSLNHAERWRSPPDFRKAGIAAGVAALVGLLTLTPYLARNAAWTGNPVFPFATGLLGQGHWDDDLAARWDRGHGLTWHEGANRTEAVLRQWLLNTGYGAAGGEPTPTETRNIARFPREYGWPVLWVAMLLGALLTVRQLRQRRAVGAMLLILAVQVGFWLVATHLQSRFLIPTLLPACIVIGLGVGRAEQLFTQRFRLLTGVAVVSLVLSLSVTSVTLMWTQTRPVPLDNGRMAPPPPFLFVDELRTLSATPLDDLPIGSRVLLVADNSSLLYIDPPILYHSAFDRNPLGEILRAVGPDSAAVTAALRDRGVTHVWAHWSELDRLHNTYGFDRAVTEASLRALGEHWRTVEELGAATLYRIDH